MTLPTPTDRPMTDGEREQAIFEAYMRACTYPPEERRQAFEDAKALKKKDSFDVE